MTTLPLILAAQNAIDKFFLPHPASNLAKDVDWAWNFVLGITTFFFVLVVGAMTFFVFKYRRKHPNQQTSSVTHNTPLEIAWTTIPLIIVLVIFFIGFKGFLNYDTPASNATPIDVQCKKWQFTFNYPNGGSDGNLYLMKGVPYVLNIQSSDVLHAVYIPSFRTQRNAVPGRTTQIWFIPEETSVMPLGTDPGGFDLFCTQYCGEQHSKMGARVYVYNDDADGKAAYDKKMVELANPFKEDNNGHPRWIPYAEVGKHFYGTYCAQCHSIDGSTNTGPTWKGLYKSEVKFSSPPGTPPMSPTDSDEKWDDYFNESILHPSAKIVEGFQNQMSDFSSQLSLTPTKDEKRRALIEFIKSIGTTPYKPAYNPKDNPDLFDATKNKDNHPESLAFKNAAATQPAKTP